VLQCVAVCCSVLKCVAVCCSVLQCVAVCWSSSNSASWMLASPSPLHVGVATSSTLHTLLEPFGKEPCFCRWGSLLYRSHRCHRIALASSLPPSRMRSMVTSFSNNHCHSLSSRILLHPYHHHQQHHFRHQHCIFPLSVCLNTTTT